MKAKKAAAIDVRTLLQPIVAEMIRAAQQPLVDEMRHLRMAIERSHAPQDGADAAVLLAIMALVGTRVFDAREVVLLAGADLSLQHALEFADLHTARDVGYLLRRCRHRQVGRFTLDVAGSARSGARWRFR